MRGWRTGNANKLFPPSLSVDEARVAVTFRDSLIDSLPLSIWRGESFTSSVCVSFGIDLAPRYTAVFFSPSFARLFLCVDSAALTHNKQVLLRPIDFSSLFFAFFLLFLL